MAFLVGVQQENGEWDAFVFDRFTAQMHYTTDILGRELPPFRYIVAYDGLPKDDTERVANELRGVPREELRSVFEARAAPLKKTLQGGTLL